MSQDAAREWDACTYNRVSEPQFAWGQRVLARLPLAGDEVVMDAGCGGGRLTAELLERLPRGRVLAVDYSENMLQTARDQLVPRFGDRVSFLCANLTDLTLEADVDVVFSTAVFHWVRDHPAMFRQLYRALKPGGLLVAQCGGGANLSRFRGHAATLMAQDPYRPFFATWQNVWEYADAAVTAARLHDAGFTEIETSLEAAPTPFPDAASFRQFITTVILRQHLTYLPDDALRARFIADAADMAARDERPFTLDYWRLNMRARRPL